jgi:hypothetical protein
MTESKSDFVGDLWETLEEACLFRFPELKEPYDMVMYPGEDQKLIAFWQTGFLSGMRFAVLYPKRAIQAVERLQARAKEEDWPQEAFDIISDSIRQSLEPTEAGTDEFIHRITQLKSEYGKARQLREGGED